MEILNLKEFSFVSIGNKFSAIPTRIQVCLEAVYEFFEELAVGLGGEKMKKYLPWVLSFFFFIYDNIMKNYTNQELLREESFSKEEILKIWYKILNENQDKKM